MKLYAINRESLQESLQQALRHWQKSEIPNVNPLIQLRLFNQLIAQAEHPTPKTAAVIRQLIESALNVLQDRNKDAAYLLRERYLNDIAIKQLTRHFAISESQFYKLQNEAIALLAEIILEQEQQAQHERRLTIEARLEPLANQQLFGVDWLQQELQNVTLSPATPWLITLEGYGGHIQGIRAPALGGNR